MKDREYNVAVLGGGPAGSSMAEVLSGSGLSVLVVEKRKTIGLPVQCAEFIHKMGYKGPTEFIAQHISNMATHLPDGSLHLSRSPGYTIHRDRYDRYLAERAEKNGADYLLGRKGYIECGRLFIDRKEVNAQLVVNAAGANVTNGHLTAYSRQVTLPLGTPVKDLHVWLGPEFPGGYAWLFPKKDSANVGLAVVPVNGMPDLKEKLDIFIETIREKFSLGTVPIRATGGKIPVSGITSFINEGVINIGDALGITHPISGEGIYRALFTGRIAGEAAVSFFRSGKKEDLDGYQAKIMKIYGRSIKRDTKKRDAWQKAIKNGGMAAEDYRALWIGFPEYYAAAH